LEEIPKVEELILADSLVVTPVIYIFVYFVSN
jgi:hypothetical protein